MTRTRNAWRDPVVLAAAGVCLLAACQAALLGEPARTAEAAVPYALGGVVAFGLRSQLDAPSAVGRLLRVIGGAGLVLAVWAIMTFLLALPDGLGRSGGFYRVKLGVTTPLGDHNTAAGLLLVVTVVTVVLAQGSRRWWVAAILTVLGLGATLSRGAAVVLVGTAALAALVGARRRVTVALAAAGGALLLVVGGAAVVLDASPPPGAQRAGPIGASLLGRFDLVIRGWELTAAHPAIGVGLGGFGANADDLPPPNDHAHNTFAQAGAEGGLPFLLLTVLVLGVLVVRVRRSGRGTIREVSALGGAALVGHGQLDILSGRLGYEVLLAALVTLALFGATDADAPADR